MRPIFENITIMANREEACDCFIPFHFREAAVNVLIIDEIDPYGKIPKFTFCAVRIEPLGGTAAGDPTRQGIATTRRP
jgi:formate dehydrogenase major subunit